MTMTERQYMEKRYYLLNRMNVALQYRCTRTAAARKRDIEKLDKEYQNQNNDG